ncbi:MAG: hypothetical protein VSS75_018720 [Candidatus Parabeggiatoa sp.]|nr:hypothetical protein [Candidatus Parabeggiatoa sp.]
MIIEDYIVDEVQAIREKQAEKYGFDIVAIIEAAKRRQNASKHQVVSFAPHKSEGVYANSKRAQDA